LSIWEITPPIWPERNIQIYSQGRHEGKTDYCMPNIHYQGISIDTNKKLEGGLSINP
jgi:hypothetical protein